MVKLERLKEEVAHSEAAKQKAENVLEGIHKTLDRFFQNNAKYGYKDWRKDNGK